ncbi:PAS domain-containing protein [Sulfitobacter sp. BDSS02]|nr:PAS domain-containing protein [Sulfitobacter sp. BDSS02]MBR9850733.1 PAS domain-containing protein [Paracoccaceae bacterium]
MKKNIWGGVSRSYLLLAFCTAVLCLGAGYAIIKKDQSIYLNEKHAELQRDLSHVADSLAAKLFGMELVANRLASFVSLSPDLTDEAVAQAADQLLDRYPGILNVAIAPDLKVTHVSPLKGNESVIGLEYAYVPTQLASVARAYRQSAAVFDGPINLVQGGRGYVLRYPVITPHLNGRTESFWGVISIVISEEGLFRGDEGLAHIIDSLQLSLREVSPAGKLIKHLYGAPELFSSDHSTKALTAFGRSWELAAAPHEDWAPYSPNMWKFLATTILSLLTLVGSILLIRRFAMRSQNAHSILEHAVESLDAGFALFDHNGRLLMANDAYADILHLDRDELKPGLSIASIFYMSIRQGHVPEAVGREDAWVKSQLKNYDRNATRVEHLPDGRWLSISLSKTPEEYTVVICADVTAQKEAQIAAEAANKQKSEFLGNVTHELRTPLTVISGYASFLRQSQSMPAAREINNLLDQPDNDDKVDSAKMRGLITKQADAISAQSEKILGASKHMLNMVNDLLDWAKAEGGDLKIAPETVSVANSVQTIIDDLNPQAEKKGIKLVGQIEDVMIEADTLRLKQVLYNLVGNALKFTNEGSITISVHPDGTRTRIAVEDTGCGIPAKDHGLIFQRFQQADGSDTRAHGGFGLGLTIARQIVKLHGGDLGVTSEPGVGSRFEFDMPSANVTPISQTHKSRRASTTQRAQLRSAG